MKAWVSGHRLGEGFSVEDALRDFKQEGNMSRLHFINILPASSWRRLLVRSCRPRVTASGRL